MVNAFRNVLIVDLCCFVVIFVAVVYFRCCGAVVCPDKSSILPTKIVHIFLIAALATGGDKHADTQTRC